MSTHRLHQVLAIIALAISCGGGEPVAPPEPAHTQGTTNAPVDDGPVCADGPGEVFDRRIAPLLAQNRPSSCSKCHGAGVNLAAFVTGDACSSMACLVQMGMVNLERPRESALLEFIDRGYSPGAETGVTDVMVANEWTGFLEWIEWSAACPEQCESTGPAQCSAPATPLIEDEEPEPEPVEVPALDLANYPCTEEAQGLAFFEHVHPSTIRCAHCHAPDGALAGIGGARPWVDYRRSRAGSDQTMRNLYTLRAINYDTPMKSRVLMKPLSEGAGGIEHGGGGKFADRDDFMHVALLQWIRMQATCSIDGALPRPDWSTDKFRDRYPGFPYVH